MDIKRSLTFQRSGDTANLVEASISFTADNLSVGRKKKVKLFFMRIKNLHVIFGKPILLKSGIH